MPEFLLKNKMTSVDRYLCESTGIFIGSCLKRIFIGLTSTREVSRSLGISNQQARSDGFWAGALCIWWVVSPGVAVRGNHGKAGRRISCRREGCELGEETVKASRASEL